MKYQPTLSKVVMYALFGSLYGYKGKIPDDCVPKDILGMDGSKIQSILFYLPSTPKAVVVLAHPFLKYGMHYFLKKPTLLNTLMQAGYMVVLFNFKGFGTSKVNGMRFADDVLSISQYIKYVSPNIPRILLGYSFGGYHGVHAVAQRPDSFHGLILDSVPLSIERFFSKGLQGRAMRWLASSSWSNYTGTAPLITGLSQLVDKPMHFIYGKEDPFFNQQDFEQLNNLSEQSSALKIHQFAHAGHLAALNQSPAQYYPLLLESIEKIVAQHS